MADRLVYDPVVDDHSDLPALLDCSFPDEEEQEAGNLTEELAETGTSSEDGDENSDDDIDPSSYLLFSAVDSSLSLTKKKRADSDNTDEDDSEGEGKSDVESDKTPSSVSTNGSGGVTAWTQWDCDGDTRDDPSTLFPRLAAMVKDCRSTEALQLLPKAETALTDSGLCELEDFWTIKYLSIKCRIDAGDRRKTANQYDEELLNEARIRINDALGLTEEGEGDASFLAFIHHQSAELFLKYNDFPSASEEIKRSQSIARTSRIKPLCYPGLPDIFVEATFPLHLKARLEALESECKKEPTLKCCGTNCETLHVRKKIYDSDFKPIKYQGYHQVACSENCLFRFHPFCWKRLGWKAKDLIRGRCLTPDCHGEIVRYVFMDTEHKEKGLIDISPPAHPHPPKTKVRKTRPRDTSRHHGAQHKAGELDESGDVTEDECPLVEECPVDDAEVPPPDLPAVPLERDLDCLEREFCEQGKKKVGRKGKDKRRDRHGHMVEEEYFHFRTDQPQLEDREEWEARIDPESVSCSSMTPSLPLLVPRDVSELRVEDKEILAERLEESPEVKEFIQFVAGLLVVEGTWVSTEEGTIGDAFRGNGPHSHVQTLIDIYGSKRAFLELPREDHRFLVHPQTGALILQENAVNESIINGAGFSFPKAPQNKDQSGTVAGSDESPSSEGHHPSTIDDYMSQHNGEQPKGQSGDSEKAEILPEQMEKVEEEDVNQMVQARVAKIMQGQEAEKEELEAQVAVTNAELRSLQEKLLHVQNQRESDRQKSQVREKELRSRIQELEAERDTFRGRAAGAEMLIVKRQKDAYRKQCRDLMEMAAKEMRTAQLVAPRLNSVEDEGMELKCRWAAYLKEWMEFRREVEKASATVGELFEKQIAEVRNGASLISLEKVALCPLPTKPLTPRPEAPEVMRPVPVPAPPLPPSPSVQREKLTSTPLGPEPPGLERRPETPNLSRDADDTQDSSNEPPKAEAAGNASKKLPLLKKMLEDAIPDLNHKDFQLSLQRVRKARRNGLKGLKLREIAELIMADMKRVSSEGDGRWDGAPRRAVSVNECAICLHDMGDGGNLEKCQNCQQFFHLDCLDQWLRTCATCPTCRTHLRLEKDFPSLGSSQPC